MSERARAPGVAKDVAVTQSIVGRVASASTIVATIAVVVLFLVTYGVVSGALTRSLAATVDADLAGLADVYATSGRAELIARIADRGTMTAVDGVKSYYLLRDGGRVIAGEMPSPPALSAQRSEHGYATLGKGASIYARATLLAPGLELLVARDTTREDAILRRLIQMFALAGAAIVVAVALLTWWRVRQVSGRLETINAAYARGDASAIVGLTEDRREDEIGALARHSGRALQRQGALLEAQRLVSDQVAHEIRTPLLHLDGRLRGLLNTIRGEATLSVLEQARGDVRRITSMLDSLLDIAATDASRGSAAGMTTFDLSDMLIDMADLYRSSIEEAGLRFTTAIGAGIVMTGDAMLMGRLVANLLDNAVKYVPAGGEIRLEARAGPVIIVSDDGPGIPDDQRPQIFERFRRGRDTSANPGHGLGLALARSIALRHDLVLTLEPSPAGCRFKVEREVAA